MNIIKPKWLLLTTLSSLSMLYADDIAIESIGLNTGYSKIFYSSEHLDVTKPTTNLYNIELYTIIENIFDTDTIRTTLNYIHNKSNDLSDNNFLVGLNRYDEFDNFTFYSGFLLGYSQLKYQKEYSVSGLTAGVQIGTEFSFTDRWKLNINAKYLVSNYTLNLAPEHTAKFTHTGTLSTSIGLKYLFFTDNDSVSIDIDSNIDIDKELYDLTDSDNDGVTNMLDNCSNSMENEIVDEFGCAKDSDDDFVSDRVDKCPNSVENEIVDKFGCAKDSDNDGVVDRLDECINSVKDEIVDTVGCAKDSDNDTVIDRLDRCPKSAKGLIVDDKGCSESYQKEKIQKMLDSLDMLH